MNKPNIKNLDLLIKTYNEMYIETLRYDIDAEDGDAYLFSSHEAHRVYPTSECLEAYLIGAIKNGVQRTLDPNYSDGGLEASPEYLEQKKAEAELDEYLESTEYTTLAPEVCEAKAINQEAVSKEQLIDRQSWTLDQKIDHALGAIEQFYNYYEGKVYISFSGGKDSTVLRHLVRRLYPDAACVFCDTGLEFPEVKEFVKSCEGATWIKPKFTFKEVVDKYGYPMISKETSEKLRKYKTQNLSDRYRGILLNGSEKGTAGMIPKKWQFLIKEDIKISGQCCDKLKKDPFKVFEKATGLKPIIGTMAKDSLLRARTYKKTGCNSFDSKRPKSTPLGIWTEADIWEYIKRFKVPYSKIYDMGYDRTGCVFCMFGAHLEKEANRFQLMAGTHPKLHNYCINKLGLAEPLKLMGVEYE